MSPGSLLLLGLATCTFAAQYGDAEIPDECIETIEHPAVSVTESDGIYTQCYTNIYTQLGDAGLKPETYTITETCTDPICRYPLETALPPGFTTGVVSCDTCHSDGPVTTTLTFPLSSVAGNSTLPPVAGASETSMRNSTLATTGPAPPNTEATAHAIKIPVAIGAAASFMYMAVWVL
jgi:hypothetical protein